MVDVEKRLLENALKNPNNQHFMLVSDGWLEKQLLLVGLCVLTLITYATNSFLFIFFLHCSCVPLYKFVYVYNYLMHINITYVGWNAQCFLLKNISYCCLCYQGRWKKLTLNMCTLMTHLKFNLICMLQNLLGWNFYFAYYWYTPLSCSNFEDPGTHGNDRYSEHMLPKIEMRDFRKGA